MVVLNLIIGKRIFCQKMGINKRPAENSLASSESDEPMLEISGGDAKDTSEDSPPCAKKLKGSGSKKKRKNLVALPNLQAILQPKNPVSLLNELRQGLTYNLVAQTGPVHAPVFTMHVLVSSSRN